jgi:hypothetical protein
MHAGHHQTWM